MAGTCWAETGRPTVIPLVCSVVGGDAGEDLNHIVTRKEAERRAGKGKHSGEFWWGLAAPLGRLVEAKAQQNRDTLPALFSKSNAANPASSLVRVWDEWRSVLSPKLHGRIPDHVVVTSSYNPNPKNNRGDNHYALVCHSNISWLWGVTDFAIWLTARRCRIEGPLSI